MEPYEKVWKYVLVIIEKKNEYTRFYGRNGGRPNCGKSWNGDNLVVTRFTKISSVSYRPNTKNMYVSVHISRLLYYRSCTKNMCVRVLSPGFLYYRPDSIESIYTASVQNQNDSMIYYYYAIPDRPPAMNAVTLYIGRWYTICTKFEWTTSLTNIELKNRHNTSSAYIKYCFVNKTRIEKLKEFPLLVSGEKNHSEKRKKTHFSYAYSGSSGASSRIQYTLGGRGVFEYAMRVPAAAVPRVRPSTSTTAWRTCTAHNWSSATTTVHFPETIPPPPPGTDGRVWYATYTQHNRRVGCAFVTYVTSPPPFNTRRVLRTTRHRLPIPIHR